MNLSLRCMASALIGFAGVSAASAGGISIGVPSITGVSPGLSQRCLQKLGITARGAQAARAAHECRKPVDPSASLNDKPAAMPIKSP